MKKRFLGIICFIYSIIIIYVWLFGMLKNFLAPNMQIYLKLSLIPMIIMGIVLSFNDKINYKFKVSDLVLLIPLIMIVFAGDGKLTVSLAKNRVVPLSNRASKTSDTEKNEIEDIPVEDKKDSVVIDNFFFDVKDSTYSYLADYITFMKGARKYIGKTIRTRGFVISYDGYLSDDYFILGKYSITCCAADAEFTGFIIKYDKSKVKDGEWFEVEGVLIPGKDLEGYDVLAIDASSVKKIDPKNEEQYVYSCSAYGNKACEEIQSYDLEY